MGLLYLRKTTTPPRTIASLKGVQMLTNKTKGIHLLSAVITIRNEMYNLKSQQAIIKEISSTNVMIKHKVLNSITIIT